MQPRPYTLRSAHVFVRDLPAARRFYVETLGMPVQFESPDYLGLDTGTCGMMVFRSEEARPERVHTCLHFGVTNIAATFAELHSKGVAFEGEPKIHEWGGIMVDFADPEGNVFHLVEYPT